MKTHLDYKSYNDIITYKNIEVAIFAMLASVCATKNDEPSLIPAPVGAVKPSEFAIFGDIMREHFQKNKEKIRERVEAAIAAAAGPAEVVINIYKMTVITDYKKLLEQF